MSRKKSKTSVIRSYVIDKDIDKFLDEEVAKSGNNLTKSSILREILHSYIKSKM